MSENERIAGLINDVVFGGGGHGPGEAWHGPALLPLVKDLPADQAAKKPFPNTHSIWELVVHIANWNEITVRRIQGEVIEGLINTEADWPRKAEGSEADWQKEVARLQKSCAHLKKAVQDFSVDKLHETFPNREYSNYVALHGIVHHVIYHTGQVALARKALAT